MRRLIEGAKYRRGAGPLSQEEAMSELVGAECKILLLNRKLEDQAQVIEQMRKALEAACNAMSHSPLCNRFSDGKCTCGVADAYSKAIAALALSSPVPTEAGAATEKTTP